MVQEGQSTGGHSTGQCSEGPRAIQAWRGGDHCGQRWNGLFKNLVFFQLERIKKKKSCHRRWIRMKSESTEVKKGRDSQGTATVI